MYEDVIEQVTDEVIKIFIDADVQVVPSHKEIREEFEILDKVYITEQMIKNVEFEIALYLDEKYPKCVEDDYSHTNMVMLKWKRRASN
jgi:hypothetical protein